MNLFRLGVDAAFILRRYGIRILRENELLPSEALRQKREFLDRARKIYDRHLAQTTETVAALDRKYQEPILGTLTVWELLERLGGCVDPSDPALYCVSQLTHSLQVVSGMEADGIQDPDLLVAALVHDLGKILLLTGEAPENVVCGNTPIGEHEDGVGLDTCVFQWNHDRFAHSRLKDQVSDQLGWLIRYHSIYIPECEHLMDERDRRYTETYLRTFQKYDKGTKSVYNMPTTSLEKCRELIERTFPKAIVF